MPLVENDAFLRELEKAFSASRTGGPASISVTMKRYDGRTGPQPRDGSAPPGASTTDFKAIFRAKIGPKRVSTHVAAKEVNKFQLAYTSVLKSNMDALKKRDKAKDKDKKSASSRHKIAA